jgi:eukaryotic-like serine/threonine-protein kinase
VPDPQDRVSQLYAEALARTVTDRADYLRRACAGDEALRVEVESLLAHASHPPSILDAPLGSLAAAVLPASGTSLLGRTVGGYRMLSALGVGGMGEVYRARDTKLGRDVAIKILPRAFANDPDRLTRFDREARVLASLNHPHIGAIYGLDAIDGTPALVLELVEGDTLAERLAHGPLPVAEVWTIATQLAEALEAAHERGIIHRDLKPANIKITPAGVVKVLDFGLAKAVAGDASSPDLTQSPTLTVGGTRDGLILGTAAYMSPEQARGLAVDKRTDIWAFGCVLYEMLSGHLAFDGATVSDTIAAIIEREPRWDTIPANARPLLRRCLEKDPKKRLRDIGDAMAWVEQARGGADATLTATVPSNLRSRWRQLGLVVAGGAMASAIVWWAQWPQPSVRPVRLEVAESKKMRLFRGAAMTVSPDGQSMVFPAIGEDGVTRYWLRSLDGVEIRPIRGTENARLPVSWSWDSRYVLLAIYDQGSSTATLEKVDLEGGPPQTMANLPGGINGAAWNRDGVIVFALAPDDPSFSPLRRVNATGGAVAPVTALVKGETRHSWPQFLPDGHHFLYLRVSSDPNQMGVYVGSIDVKPEDQSLKRLLATNRQAYYAASPSGGLGHVVFLRDATLMAQPFDAVRMELTGEPLAIADGVDSFATAFYGLFSVSETGTLVYRQGTGPNDVLTWLDQHGTVTGTVGEPGDPNTPAVSPDGTRVAVSLGPAGAQHIWIVDAVRNTTTSFTFDPANSDNYPVWSPDSKSIVFASTRTGQTKLYIKPADGSGQERLLTDRPGVPMSWSNDGRFLLFMSFPPTGVGDIWVLPDPRRAAAASTPVALLETPFIKWGARFSPDGRWIAYLSNESGPFQIYVRPFALDGKTSAAGAKWLVSKGAGSEPRWRSDGRQLFYGLLNSQDVMAVDIETSKGFHAGTPQLLFTAPAAFGGTAWDVAPDGNRFLVIGPPNAGLAGRFTVMLNWQAALKQKAR